MSVIITPYDRYNPQYGRTNIDKLNICTEQFYRTIRFFLVIIDL